MFNFLHTFEPQPILAAFGPIQIHWYGLCLVLAISAGFFFFYRSARLSGWKTETIFDFGFWATIGGLIGARIYEIFLDTTYYFSNPLAMFKVWEGGLAIHGALIGGALAIYIFLRRQKKLALDCQFSWLKIADFMAPALALGQAIGRFGNYFNQELFGRPTDLPWGIPIAIISRPAGYSDSAYFHPTFLYESLGNLLIFVVLWRLSRRSRRPGLIIGWYAVAYGILRFSLEFIKIDQAPLFLGWRWPQIASILLVSVGLSLLIFSYKHEKKHPH